MLLLVHSYGAIPGDVAARQFQKTDRVKGELAAMLFISALVVKASRPMARVGMSPRFKVEVFDLFRGPICDYSMETRCNNEPQRDHPTLPHQRIPNRS